MRTSYKQIAATLCLLAVSGSVFAGNKDRTGQAGATELLINPWAASTGVMGLNTAYVSGIEAMKGNIAGLSKVQNFEVGGSYSAYLKMSNISIINASLAKKVGNSGVVGANITSMSFGAIERTDVSNPTAGIGSYNPQFFNIQVGYAQSFSDDAIHAGVAVTFVSEAIQDAKASGAVFEAGVQYQTGARDNFHFGVTLRNVGTNMKFSGEGFSFNGEAPTNANIDRKSQSPTDGFQVPTYLNIATAYDFYLDENRRKNTSTDPQHRLTAMAGFTSNTFISDYFGAGLEYAFREQFMLRAGYRYESGVSDGEDATTFYKGFSAGASIFTKGKGSRLGFDYSYRPTQNPNNGVHVFSLRAFLAAKRRAAPTAEGQ